MSWFSRSTGLLRRQGRHQPTVPSFLQPANRFRKRAAAWIATELNFYRVHVIVFVFVPLIASAIFYASNEDVRIPFIDCLFVCFSAMTVTGLATINISTATVWQQVILYILMWIGNISAVSVTMIAVRRHFFRAKFDRVIRNNAAARKRAHDVEQAHNLERKKDIIRLQRLVGLRSRHKHEREDRDSDGGLSPSSTGSTERIAEAELEEERIQRQKKKDGHKKKRGPLRADMVVRVDRPAVLINGNGMPSSGRGSPRRSIEEDPSSQPALEQTSAVSGSILNTPEQIPSPGASTGPQVSIRHPLSNVVGESDFLCDSPREMRSRANTNGGLFADTISPKQGEDPSAKQTTVEDDADTEAVALPVSSALPRIDQGRATHFGEDLATPSSVRRRRGSDPSGQNRERLRRGSESAATGSNPRMSRAFAQPRGGGGLGAGGDERMPRSQTIEFAEPPRVGPGERLRFQDQQPDRGYTTGVMPGSGGGLQRSRTFDRTYTAPGFPPLGLARTTTMTAKERGFGGFPTPFEIAGQVLSKVVPRARDRLKRSTTLARTATVASALSFSRHDGNANEGATKAAPYLSFDVTVTGNSMFHSLTEAQRDELGGVEYRALDFLAKIVPVYFIGINLFCVVLVAPYLASSAFDKYRPVFEDQAPHVPNTTWFWLFQTISAYSNTGLSLIDTSMIRMADAYFLLIPMAFLILVGNTALPIFLRLWIWICSLCVSKDSRAYETLRFILDHPRRCFIYLFPSGQTWFLLLIVITLTSTDWVAFEVLDINNPAAASVPTPQRIFDGFFQSIAVRAAGFQVVSLLDIAPAVQFLYVVMMYISAYPIALSVRSTNVYEERSLGVFTEKAVGDDDEQELPTAASARGWGAYLAAHARRQLAFDMWWLGFALWLVCIIERHNIQDPESNGWFTVFSCLFELTSAYGTVGLSTGTPFDAFSLSGRFRTLSKLVVIATMIRGRHRGLPVAIDRSILLPNDLEEQDAAEEAWSMVDMERSRSMDVHRTGSVSFPAPFYNGSREVPVDDDFKVRSPSPIDKENVEDGPLYLRTSHSTNPTDHQSQHSPIHPLGLHKNFSPEEAFQLDSIKEDKGGPTRGEDPPSSVTLTSRQMEDTSPSVSSHEGSGNSAKGKGREASPGSPVMRSPSRGWQTGRPTPPKPSSRGISEEDGGVVDVKLAERYGSSAPHLTDSSKSATGGNIDDDSNGLKEDQE